MTGSVKYKPNAKKDEEEKSAMEQLNSATEFTYATKCTYL